jgi:hypothetical protein
VNERTEEDLRGFVVELVAVDESGKDLMSSLDQPEVQKLRSIFSHQKLDLADTVTKVHTMPFSQLIAVCIAHHPACCWTQWRVEHSSSRAQKSVRHNVHQVSCTAN